MAVFFFLSYVVRGICNFFFFRVLLFVNFSSALISCFSGRF